MVRPVDNLVGEGITKKIVSRVIILGRNEKYFQIFKGLFVGIEEGLSHIKSPLPPDRVNVQ